MASASSSTNGGVAENAYEGRVTALRTAWDVDRHIVLASAEKVVLVRFSSYESPPDDVVFHQLHKSSRHNSANVDEDDDDEEEDDLLSQLEGIERRSKNKKKGKEKKRSHSEDRPHRKRPRSEEKQTAGSSDASALAGMEHYLATQKMDALLEIMAPKVRKFCTIFTVDTTKVTEFNALYELGHDRDPFAVMFFYRNTHIKVDLGTGNTNKLNFYAFEEWTDLLPIVEAVYRAGKMGKHITSTERQFSTVSLRR